MWLRLVVVFGGVYVVRCCVGLQCVVVCRVSCWYLVGSTGYVHFRVAVLCCVSLCAYIGLRALWCPVLCVAFGLVWFWVLSRCVMLRSCAFCCVLLWHVAFWCVTLCYFVFVVSSGACLVVLLRRCCVAVVVVLFVAIRCCVAFHWRALLVCLLRVIVVSCGAVLHVVVFYREVVWFLYRVLACVVSWRDVLSCCPSLRLVVRLCPALGIVTRCCVLLLGG